MSVLELQKVRKDFVKPLRAADRLVRLIGRSRPQQAVRAVDGVDLAIAEGEVVGLVGESGSGKSTLGRIAAGVLAPDGGDVLFRGQPMSMQKGTERRVTDLKIQMIFQDPMASLNPRMRVLEIIGEAPRIHGQIRARDQDACVADSMTRVGLDPSTRLRYPHQFSGGQRTRIGIARALAVKPEILVCDEATAALDVSIQAQVLNLFLKLRRELSLTYLFISHDLGVVEHIADRVAVMYLGRIVELAPAGDIFSSPNHPYTRALLADVPRLDLGKKRFAQLPGEIPSPLDPPSGCHFHPRCPLAGPRCKAERPKLIEIAPQRLSACHLNEGGVGNQVTRPSASMGQLTAVLSKPVSSLEIGLA